MRRTPSVPRSSREAHHAPFRRLPLRQHRRPASTVAPTGIHAAAFVRLFLLPLARHAHCLRSRRLRGDSRIRLVAGRALPVRLAYRRLPALPALWRLCRRRLRDGLGSPRGGERQLPVRPRRVHPNPRCARLRRRSHRRAPGSPCDELDARARQRASASRPIVSMMRQPARMLPPSVPATLELPPARQR